MGWAVDVQALDESFPRPTASAVAQAEEVFATLPAGTVTVVDSLALGAIPEIIERHGRVFASWRWCICRSRLTSASTRKRRRDSRTPNGVRSLPRRS